MFAFSTMRVFVQGGYGLEVNLVVSVSAWHLDNFHKMFIAWSAHVHSDEETLFLNVVAHLLNTLIFIFSINSLHVYLSDN